MPEPDGGPARRRLSTRPATLDAAEIAWLALLPSALIAVLAIVFLGPPLGHALFTHASDRLWPPGWWETTGHPEPAKQGRFLIAALAPLLLAAAVLAGARRRIALSPRTVRVLSLASLALVLGLIAVALLEQHPTFTGPEEPVQDRVAPLFGLDKVLAAAAIVAVSIAVLHRRRSLANRLVELTRETRPRRWAALGIAVAFVAIWVLKAVTTDALGLGVVSLNLPWTLNDAVAVLDGRTPLVDYHPIYAKLLPYVSAPVLAAFGTTALVYTAFMALLAGLALIAVYATLRRVTRRSLLACALFVPFVATSDISVPIDAGVDAGLRTSPMMLASQWPMRYGGAYLLLWLTARHIDGDRPRHAWVLFLVGGVVAIDSLELGIGAVAATVAALLCARPPSMRALRSRVLELAGGLLAAVVLVALVTLLHSGRLPRLELLLEWPQIFTTLGWFSMPLPTWELHLAVYATFVAATAVAAVRVARGDDDALLTSMLAWSGVFGLLTGGYFVGRPDAIKLTAVLSAWSLALSMLTVASVRALAARAWRPTAPQLLVLFGFALSVSSLALLSPPSTQIDRLTRSTQASTYLASAKRFIGERTRRGETVAVLVPMSFVVTRDLGLRNVAPYGFMNAIVTQSQMTRLLVTLRRERVAAVFVPEPNSNLLNEGDSAWAQLRVLEAIGFPRRTSADGIVELSPG
ncbi:MAG: hypothetical protein ACTHOE_13855 [Conexibacter sp.]